MSRIVSDPGFREVLSQVQIREDLGLKVGKDAIEFVGKLLKDEKALPTLRLKAAELVLDKMGFREGDGGK